MSGGNHMERSCSSTIKGSAYSQTCNAYLVLGGELHGVLDACRHLLDKERKGVLDAAQLQALHGQTNIALHF